MTFLNSAILFGLIAGTIPIIIHLITRQKAKKVNFSSIKFLIELKNQQIKRLKIRQILLLILRTLILLLLILAFARPTLKGNLSASHTSSAKTSAVIILDNSLSMGVESNGQPLLEAAKQKVIELGDSFKPGDEIFGLFPVNGAPSIFDGPRYNFETVSRLVGKVKLSTKQTDILSALGRAKEILENAINVNKEIYLISDLQKSGFDSGQELTSSIFNEENFKLFIIPVRAQQVSNLVVEKVQPVNQIIEKGKVFELEAHIRNVGDKPQRNRLVQIFIEGKRSGQATATVNPGESRKIKFRVIPQSSGLKTGSVLIEDDDLYLDNRRHFTFYVPEQHNVLLVSLREQDAVYLRLALKPDQKGKSSVKIDQITPEKIEFGTLNKYQVLVLSNVPRIDGAMLASVKSYVNNGGGLIIFLGDDVDLKNYNENICAELELPPFVETIGELGKSRDYLTLGKIDFSHPIFTGVFETSQKEIDSPSFYFLAKAKTSPNHDRIIEFSNGEPFLVETSAGQGRVMLFTTSVDPEWSDLYLKGMFVPVLNRCVAYLAGHTSKAEQNFLVDDQISMDVEVVDNLSGFKIRKPDGTDVKVIPKIGNGYYKISFDDTDMAGIYSLLADEEVITELAVNPNPVESDIQNISSDELKRIAGNTEIITVDRTESLAGLITASRFGRELWKYVIGLVLLLLFIEMLIAREGNEPETEVSTDRFARK